MFGDLKRRPSGRRRDRGRNILRLIGYDIYGALAESEGYLDEVVRIST